VRLAIAMKSEMERPRVQECLKTRRNAATCGNVDLSRLDAYTISFASLVSFFFPSFLLSSFFFFLFISLAKTRPARVTIPGDQGEGGGRGRRASGDQLSR